jgi:hypothetical protein
MVTIKTEFIQNMLGISCECQWLLCHSRMDTQTTMVSITNIASLVVFVGDSFMNRCKRDHF